MARPGMAQMEPNAPDPQLNAPQNPVRAMTWLDVPYIGTGAGIRYFPDGGRPEGYSQQEWFQMFDYGNATPESLALLPEEARRNYRPAISPAAPEELALDPQPEERLEGSPDTTLPGYEDAVGAVSVQMLTDAGIEPTPEALRGIRTKAERYVRDDLAATRERTFAPPASEPPAAEQPVAAASSTPPYQETWQGPPVAMTAPGPRDPWTGRASAPRPLRTQKEAEAYTARPPAADASPDELRRFQELGPNGSPYRGGDLLPSQEDMDMWERGYVRVMNPVTGESSYRLAHTQADSPGTSGRRGTRNDLMQSPIDPATGQQLMEADGKTPASKYRPTSNYTAPDGTQMPLQTPFGQGVDVYEPTPEFRAMIDKRDADARVERLAARAGVTYDDAQGMLQGGRTLDDLRRMGNQRRRDEKQSRLDRVSQHARLAGGQPTGGPGGTRAQVEWMNEGWGRTDDLINRLGQENLTDWQRAALMQQLSPRADMQNPTPLGRDAANAAMAARFMTAEILANGMPGASQLRDVQVANAEAQLPLDVRADKERDNNGGVLPANTPAGQAVLSDIATRIIGNSYATQDEFVRAVDAAVAQGIPRPEAEAYFRRHAQTANSGFWGWLGRQVGITPFSDDPAAAPASPAPSATAPPKPANQWRPPPSTPW
jgi:hypothetical protein